MRFSVSDWDTACFEYWLRWLHLQCCLVVKWLVPCEIAAILAQVLWTPYNHALVYSVTLFQATNIECIHVYLAVTCHLHFWQNDATVVTWGWNGNWNKSQHRKLTMEKKSLLWGFEPETFWSQVHHSITELSQLPHPLSTLQEEGLVTVLLTFNI